MLIEGHQVGIELEQKDTLVKGAMGERQLLEGTYVDRVLTLKREKPEDAPSPPPGSAQGGPITARMLDDGTLEGELSTPSPHARRHASGNSAGPSGPTRPVGSVRARSAATRRHAATAKPETAMTRGHPTGARAKSRAP